MVTTAEHYDVVIIGGGPGGYAAALYGAAAGLNVAMIEKAKIGGTCLHVGCIPAKELLETAHVYRTVVGAGEFGIDAGPPKVDLTVTQERKQKVIDQLANGVKGLLKKRKVTVLDGWGRLGPDRTVTVSGGSSGDVTLTGDAVILAAGSLPRTIPGFDVDGTIVMTSDEVLSISELPETAAVIGGGAIGCEFASMMADMGTKVTILEALPKILPGATRTSPRSSCARSRAATSTCRPGWPSRATRPSPTVPAPPSISATARRSTSTSSWSPSAAGPTPTRSVSRAPRSRSTTGASSSSTSCAGRPSRACTRWVT